MIEIIPKTQPQPFLLKNIVVYGAVVVLVVATSGLASFVILKNNANNRIADIEAVLRAGETVQQRNLQKSVLGYQRKIQDFTQLLSSRKDATPFLPLVDSRTHPSVFFKEASLDVLLSRIVLKGQTTDFRTLGEQLVSFEETKQVENMKLSDVSLAEGSVVFTLELVFGNL